MVNCKVAGDCLPGGNFFRHDRPEGYPGAVAHAQTDPKAIPGAVLEARTEALRAVL